MRRPRVGARRVALAFAAVVAMAVAGCSADAVDEPPVPDELVQAFLAAAAGGAPDRGWSQLHPMTRASMFGNDREAYIALAEVGPWDEFAWKITNVVPDDPSLHFVHLDISADEVPALLVEARNHFFLVGPLDARLLPHLAVRYDRDGHGIWPKGG